MSATLADPSIFVDGGLRCWRPPGFFHSTSCRICKTSIIVRDKVAKRYQRASKDHLGNLRKTWGKAVHKVVHRTVDSNSQLDSDSTWDERPLRGAILHGSTWHMNLNGASSACAEIQASGAHRRSPNLAEWFQSALTWSCKTKHRHFEILQIQNSGSLYPWNNAWTITAMLGYTLNSLDTFRQVAVQRVPSHNSNPESSRQRLPKWGEAVKQLWEAFHPIPASSGRSSSTVVGQMRNTPLSSLRIWVPLRTQRCQNVLRIGKMNIPVYHVGWYIETI